MIISVWGTLETHQGALRYSPRMSRVWYRRVFIMRRAAKRGRANGKGDIEMVYLECSGTKEEQLISTRKKG